MSAAPSAGQDPAAQLLMQTSRARGVPTVQPPVGGPIARDPAEARPFKWGFIVFVACAILFPPSIIFVLPAGIWLYCTMKEELKKD